MASRTLQTWFPSTTSPFICNAPMYGFANPTVATAVSRAGGLGFIGGGFQFSVSSPQMSALSTQLSTARSLLKLSPTATLPIGVGFITCFPDDFLTGVLPLLAEHKPAAIWLFAPPTPEAHAELIPAMKKAGADWGIKVFVQVGTVQAAREAVKHGADVLVLQGSDAGGHQWASGTSFLTLVPEVMDTLAGESKDSGVQILAAGGIMDGRGIAAALVLGANGVVMGTRFVATTECPAPDIAKELYVSTNDGGQSTLKSTVMDDIQGTAIWGPAYDGRAIITASLTDHLSGVPLEENITKFKSATEAGDPSRKIYWAGAGIGLVKEILSIEMVVKGSQEQARQILGRGASL